jgi:Uri superfamily endonuclease
MSQLHFFGDITGGGTYLLHARLARRWTFVFGRYRRGIPVSLAAGDYLYVGSALARRGSSTLARRLLRHATRTGGRPPHALRSHLLAELQAAGSPGLQPPQIKTLRWHIDYLLDVEVVSLAAIYVLGDGAAVERTIAAHLVADPQVWAPAPGLGAGDDWGGTHLLGVQGDAVWWQELSAWLEGPVFYSARSVVHSIVGSASSSPPSGAGGSNPPRACTADSRPIDCA